MHGYLDEPLEGCGQNAGKEMLKVQSKYQKPQTRIGRRAVLMLCWWMTLISVSSETKEYRNLWRKRQLKRKILVERADIVTWRSRCLKEV